MVTAFAFALAMSSGSGVYSQEEETATDAQKKVMMPSKINGIIRDIGASTDEGSLRNLIDKALSETFAYEDYEKFAVDAKTASGDPSFSNKDYLYYAIARARFDQLSSLSKSNDIETGRLYMSVNDKYFSEAMEYLDKAAASTKSKSLIIDNDLLRFMIFREKFQSQKSDAVFDAIAGLIAKYSDDANINKKKLEDLFEKLKTLELPKYAIKLKILYASKIDPETARGVIDEIRISADRYFEQNNMKEAANLINLSGFKVSML